MTTSPGKLLFRVFTQEVMAPAFLRSPRWRVQPAKRPIVLIVDRRQAHRLAAVVRWLARYKNRVRMFLLPNYSPDLNSDELLS